MKIFNILFIFLLFCLNGCGQIVDAPWGFSSKEYNYSYNLGKEDIVIEKAVNKARIFLNLLFPISLSSFCLLLEILK